MKVAGAASKWLPSASAAGKLFLTGATVGPIIDGLHNQCLLRYNVAPITLDAPGWINLDSVASSPSYFEPHLFASSWLVPPLLGFAYIVLGGVLSRILQTLLDAVERTSSTANDSISTNNKVRSPSSFVLFFKAVLAVVSTGLIVRFSQYLILHPTGSYGFIDNTAVFESSESVEQHLLILITAAITQWAYLDGTLASLLAASAASILGPLSELPFVANGIWEYLPEAGDLYLPLQSIDPSSSLGQWFQGLWGDQYPTLALNAITGPCYFAVTMDAIALGRWFESLEPANARHHSHPTEDIPTNRLFIASSRDENVSQEKDVLATEEGDSSSSIPTRNS
jgi:hypothetical protein